MKKWPILWAGVVLLHAPFFTSQHIPKIAWLCAMWTVCFAIATYYCKRTDGKWRLASLEWLWMAFLLCISASAVAHLDHIETWARASYWLLLFAIHLWYSQSAQTTWNTTIKVLLAAMGVASVYGIVQYFALGRLHSYPTYVSSFGNVNFAAAGIVVLVPLALPVTLREQRPFHKHWQWVCLVAMVFYLLSIGSRGSLLALLAAMLVALVWIGKKWPWRRLAQIAVVAICLGGVVCLFSSSRSYVVGKFSSLADFSSNTSNQVRLLVWDSTMAMSGEAGWAGVGCGQFASRFYEYRNPLEYQISKGRIVSHPHNTSLLIASENGIVALLCFWAIIAVALAFLLTAIRRADPPHEIYCIGACAALIALVVQGIVSEAVTSPVSGMLLPLITGFSAAQSRVKFSRITLTTRFAAIPKGLLAVILGGCSFIAVKATIGDFYLATAQHAMKERSFTIALAKLDKAGYWWNNGIVQMERGRCLRVLGRHREAIGVLQDAAILAPHLENIHLNLGLCHLLSEQYRAARDCWLRTLQYFPYSAVAHYNLGKLALVMEQPRQAIAHLTQAVLLEPLRMGDDEYRRDLAKAHFQLGGKLLRERQYHAGEKQFSRYIELAGEDRDSFVDLEKAYIHLGICHIQQNQRPEALTAWLAMERIFPDSHVLHYNLGKLFAELRQGTKALFYLQKAAQAYPQYDKTLEFQMILGAAYEVAGDAKAALLCYAAARRLESDNMLPVLHIGRIFQHLGSNQIALSHLHTVRERGTPVQQAQANFYMAQIYDAMAEKQLAIACYLKAARYLDIYPLHLRLGELFYEQKNLQAAWKFFKKAAQLETRDYQALLHMARIAWQQGYQPQTLQCLVEAQHRGFRDWQEIEKDPIFADLIEQQQYRQLKRQKFQK